MSQSLATSKGPIPNILGAFIGDFGTLVIWTAGKYYYLCDTWQPDKGMTRPHFIKTFHVAPPTNVPDGWWGIVPGMTDDITCRDCNWTKGTLQAALDMFVESRGQDYLKPDGQCMNPFNKGRLLARKKKDRDRMMSMVVDAPPDITDDQVVGGHVQRQYAHR